MRLLIVIIISISLVNCKSNQSKKEIVQKNDCSTFNDKYVEYAMAEKKDSAFYYIDKAILCAPGDDFFKTEKIKLLLKYKDYSAAAEFARKLATDETLTYKMLYGIILLKQGNVNAENVLKESYVLLSKKTKSYNKENSNLHFYKLGFDNYFEGKEYALDMVNKFNIKYTSKHDIQLADYIKSMIINESKEKVLYKQFGLED